MRFVSRAVRKIYKIRTESTLAKEVFSEIIFVIYIIDYALYFKVEFCIVLFCKRVICTQNM